MKNSCWNSSLVAEKLAADFTRLCWPLGMVLISWPTPTGSAFLCAPISSGGNGAPALNRQILNVCLDAQDVFKLRAAMFLALRPQGVALIGEAINTRQPRRAINGHTLCASSRDFILTCTEVLKDAV
ncbi:hypothetical protein [Paraburkholderia fungorum]|uniref:hypothetical protein n=1 Tax=Paraburkholderia fungorum TaxID=134537 RepID=UPI002096B1EB|nr:hypothetical protein [Paraburkholderia fungorum]